MPEGLTLELEKFLSFQYTDFSNVAEEHSAALMQIAIPAAILEANPPAYTLQKCAPYREYM